MRRFNTSQVSFYKYKESVFQKSVSRYNLVLSNLLKGLRNWTKVPQPNKNETLIMKKKVLLYSTFLLGQNKLALSTLLTLHYTTFLRSAVKLEKYTPFCLVQGSHFKKLW